MTKPSKKVKGLESAFDEIQADRPNQVGDIDSDLKGTGARYNNGKPDYSLVLLHDLAEFISNSEYNLCVNDYLFDTLTSLASFQETHDERFLKAALQELGIRAFEESTYVFTYGAAKYKSWNWCKGMAWSVPLACAVRHLLAAIQGQEYDEESKRLHIGHVVCNILMLLHYSRHYKEGNDLPPLSCFE